MVQMMPVLRAVVGSESMSNRHMCSRKVSAMAALSCCVWMKAEPMSFGRGMAIPFTVGQVLHAERKKKREERFSNIALIMVSVVKGYYASPFLNFYKVESFWANYQSLIRWKKKSKFSVFLLMCWCATQPLMPLMQVEPDFVAVCSTITCRSGEFWKIPIGLYFFYASGKNKT